AYRLGRLLFRSEIGGLSTAIVISFHPMFSFLSAGVNNDNLLNLFSIIMIFLTLSIFEEGLTYAKAVMIGLVSGLGLLTKPLIFPLIVGVGIALIYEAIITKRPFKQTIKYWSPLLIIGTLSGGFIILNPLINGRLPYLTNFKDISDKKDLTFWQYLPGRIDSYYRETFVWYWG